MGLTLAFNMPNKIWGLKMEIILHYTNLSDSRIESSLTSPEMFMFSSTFLCVQLPPE